MGIFDDIGQAASDGWDDLKEGAEDVYNAVTGAEVAVENFIDTVIHTVEDAVEAVVDAASDAPSFAENVLDKFEHAMETKGREMHAVLVGAADDGPRPHHYEEPREWSHLSEPGIDGDVARFAFAAKYLGSPEVHAHSEPMTDLLLRQTDVFDSSGDDFHTKLDWNKIDNNPLSVPAAVMEMTPSTSVRPIDIPAAQADLKTSDGCDSSGDLLHFNSNSVATAHDPLSTPTNVANFIPQEPFHAYETPVIHTEHLSLH